ncbi:MAG: hypothetical protein WCO82_04985 [Sphingomonadales bacterium]|jgi:YidC/Oxa1 family membrane protein insertase
MTNSAGDAAGVTLAYLDPISWLVTVQVLGGVGGWIWLRIRKGLRRIGLAVSGELTGHQVDRLTVEDSALALSELTARARLVLVLEGPRDWPYLEPVVSRLATTPNLDLWCISAGKVPIEGLERLGKPVRCVEQPGQFGWQLLLARLAADVVITTLTDLGSSQFPKSPNAVYCYVFHSSVSTHVAYAPGAFDGYDIVFCPGPTHATEIDLSDRLRGVEKRRILAAGYPFTDEILASSVAPVPAPTGRALIAPSWTNDGIYPLVWGAAARALLDAGWKVMLRPHPETMKRSPAVLKDLQNAFADEPRFVLDDTAAAGLPPGDADLMVSDWSGAAFEFALRPHRQVVFVDTPRKVRNPVWRLVSESSIEESRRGDLGVVLAPDAVHRIGDIVGRPHERSSARTGCRADWLSNPGHAADVIADELRPLLVRTRT